MTRVEELERALLQAQEEYDLGKPQMSDEAFDRLVAQLRARHPRSRVLAHLGAPRTDEKIAHRHPALSLQKVKIEQLQKWVHQRGDSHYVVQPKYDGVSLILRYDRGKLVSAATRGDGLQGDDVLENAVLIQTIPTTITCSGVQEIRGEAVMPKSVFCDVEGDFANARNLIAGLMMRKSGDRSLLRKCVFVAYEHKDSKCPRYSELVQALDLLNGFYTPQSFVVKSKDVVHKVVELTQWMSDIRAGRSGGQLDALSTFELDGFVVRMDTISAGDKLGATSHHPLHSCAIKLSDDAHNTVLRGVEWQVSRSGVIAPVGHVEPVELAGATVTRVTLHNADFIKGLGIQIGDVVSMTRRGAVIPHVESLVAPGTSREPIVVPPLCPSCGSAVVQMGAAHRCTGTWCDEQAIGQLLHWATVAGMLGFGYGTLKKLYDARLMRTPVDFYRCDDWTVVGEKIGRKLAGEVQKTRLMPMATFLQALGIDGLGKSLATSFADTMSMDELMSWAHSFNGSNKCFIPVAGLSLQRAGVLADALVAHQDLIDALLEHITIDVPVAVNSTSSFSGKSIVFTGALASMGREEAQAAVRALGAKTPDGLTRATDILVVGGEARDAQRGKRDKAEKYNAKGASIEVIDEDEFLARLAKG